MIPYLTQYFGNPSSSHVFGPTAKRAIELARLQVAKLISCTAPYDEIIFTGCGTESDNRAIDIAIYQYLKQRDLNMRTCPESQLPEIVTSPIEHPAVLCYLRQLKAEGRINFKIIPVNSEGIVTLSEVEKALTKNTAMVTIMHSNNEVGTLQPIRAISHVITSFNKREKTKILFHSDAAQSVGKIPIDVHFLGVDMLTLVGHKYGAPKGIAILYARRNTVTDIPGMLVGGGQEKGRRGGTENVPYIVGLGTASAYASSHLLENIVHLLSLKLHFLSLLQTTLQTQGWLHLVKFNGPKRSVHYQQLQEDMKVLKLLFQSNQSPTASSSSMKGASPTAATTAGADTANPMSPSHHQHHHHPHNHQRVYVAENTAADVLEQLPNTISISFKGLIGHEIVSELGNRVSVVGSVRRRSRKVMCIF
jgi:cysteine desulfurase